MPNPPKRADQRLGHRTKAEQARTTRVSVAAGPVEMPAPSDAWHEIARGWYESLGDSGQVRFMEPSDWQAARLVAEVMTRNLASEKMNGQLFTGVWSAMNDLLTTESARRRVHIQIERRDLADDDGDRPDNVTDISDYSQLYG